MTNLAKAPAAAARLVAHTLRHPRHSAEEAVGLVKGAAAMFVAGHADTQPHTGATPTPEPARPAEHQPAAPTPEPAEPAEPRKDQGDPIEEAARAAVERPRGPAEVAQPRPEVATEPSAPTARADADEAYEDEDTEVETPVGTTGADVAHNPDTTDTDLQQPGTEPLMDPATTKQVKAESETLRKAAAPDKG